MDLLVGVVPHFPIPSWCQWLSQWGLHQDKTEEHNAKMSQNPHATKCKRTVSQQDYENLELAYQKTCASKWFLIILELTLQNQHRFVLLLVKSKLERKHANANLMKDISYLLLNNDLVFRKGKKTYKIDNGLHCSLMLQNGQITGVLRKYLSSWQLISIRL